MGPVLLLTGTLYVGAFKLGSIPPLGPFLDPFSGVWAVAVTTELPAKLDASIASLTDTVTVVYDDRAVPHIFARSRLDAARALGYVVARDRLFQLEIQTRAAAGKLSELFGRRTLAVDRYFRSLWLAASAGEELAELQATDPGSVELLHAYAQGVNAWIGGLQRRNFPLEYHFLDVRPMRWEPVHTLYLIKYMGWTLARFSRDRDRLEVAALIGEEAANALFPIHSPLQEPLEPNGQTEARFDFVRVPPPGEPDAAVRATARAIRRAGFLSDRFDQDEAHASNNWAVSPWRTANGYAILAGDPHLDLTLPSTWYETHLLVPDEQDVYGVTFPGAPDIVIGFNRDVAWSFTNTGADVMDFYEEILDNAAAPTAYRFDGAWRPLERRIEEYRDSRGNVLAVDTLYRTHRGPLMIDGDTAISLRWTVLEGSGVVTSFGRIRSAKSVVEWLRAMESLRAPAQNGLVADRAGSIAIRSIGHYPIHPDDGNGQVIRDGTTSRSDWLGYWAVDDYPGAINPPQGYLASANQEPIDPRVNDRYLGDDWWVPWRAMQINKLLRTDSSVTPDAMRRYQTHPGSARADWFVPALLEAAARRDSAGRLGPEEREAAELLAEWDRRYTKENERAVLFEYAMSMLQNLLWDELEKEDGRRVDTPRETMIAMLLRDPESEWWDRRSTDATEQRDDILVAALAAALERAVQAHGNPTGGGWRWEGIRHMNIPHIARFPGLAVTGIPVQGGRETLNPSSGAGMHGASWRMVVELGSEVRAWSTYPGGQSGNPVSSRYADRLEKWAVGELDEVLFPRAASEIPESRVLSVLTLEPGA